MKKSGRKRERKKEERKKAEKRMGDRGGPGLHKGDAGSGSLSRALGLTWGFVSVLSAVGSSVLCM